MSPKPVFTAVSFTTTASSLGHDDDVRSMITQPLLVDEEQQTDDTIIILKKPSHSQNSDAAIVTNACNSRFLVLGALTGFFIQVVSLGAYAVLLLQYNKTAGDIDTNKMDHMAWWPFWKTDGSETISMSSMITVDWFLYGILSVLTQIDLVIYVLIWVAFTCTMTRNGMQFLRFHYQDPSLRRRGVFVLGVYFLVGIVVGAFGAWSLIDIYLGFPIPFFPIVATVVIDLGLCYMMVWCYDLGQRRDRVSGDETECDEDDDCDDEEASCVCC
ncbi:hypothetical protein IV203_034352 [Nitzschia inconspicua]|uniref:Transmembrane protein n=1 Tax=Nitzschia inconspicua TaxID=303405 RepID=A0A9K3P945_9STRA|nr:hypothetical protein IV203_022824 [Nitzschia inconspicua]KAG7373628.1 hypothetical protein IV203_034352 [Nitzschia inconspicua]